MIYEMEREMKHEDEIEAPEKVSKAGGRVLRVLEEETDTAFRLPRSAADVYG